jgi:two-component system, NtrC family, sensor kinase
VLLAPWDKWGRCRVTKRPRARAVLGWVALLLVVAVVLWIEGGRRAGSQAPAPFLVLYASVVAAAAIGGLRPGVTAGAVGAGFVVYSAQVGFGPLTLTGGVVSVGLGVTLFLGSGALVGVRTDRRGRALRRLSRRAALGLSDALAEGYVVLDRDATILDANEEYARIVGIAREELLGMQLGSREMDTTYHAPDGSLADLKQMPLPRAIATGEAQYDQLVGVRRADGMLSWLRMNTAPVRGDDPPKHFVTTMSDVTERVEQEARAAEEHATLATILENAPNGILLFDEWGVILRANAALAEMFGWQLDELTGQNVRALVPDAALPSMVRTSEVVGVRRGGKSFAAAIRVAEVAGGGEQGLRYVGTVQDVSERKVLEFQLSQSKRLESVGQLAAGIAYEINTPTQFVGDNTRFLERAFADLGPLHESHARLLAAAEETGMVSEELLVAARAAVESSDIGYLQEEIPSAIRQTLEGVERVATIVRAMKEFSHPGSGSKESANLNQALESTATVSRNEWKYVAELELELAEDLPDVPCLVTELKQAFLNIIIYAAHAIEEVARDEGRTEEQGVIRVSTVHVGDWAEVRISDSGGGIPEEVRERIFDPFSTTKVVGRGTGQGLAIARSVVVDQHGGTPTVESEPGQGSTFVIRLPYREDAARAAQGAGV